MVEGELLPSTKGELKSVSRKDGYINVDKLLKNPTALATFYNIAIDILKDHEGGEMTHEDFNKDFNKRSGLKLAKDKLLWGSALTDYKTQALAGSARDNPTGRPLVIFFKGGHYPYSHGKLWVGIGVGKPRYSFMDFITEQYPRQEYTGEKPFYRVYRKRKGVK